MTLDVSDNLAIQKLMADYNFAIDMGDAEAFAACFAEGGSLETIGMGVTSGTDDLIEFVGVTNQMVPGGRHMVSNISIDGDSAAGTATTRAYLQMYTTAGGAGSTSLMISGTYADTLTKTDGEWKFVTRVMTPDA